MIRNFKVGDMVMVVGGWRSGEDIGKVSTIVRPRSEYNEMVGSQAWELDLSPPNVAASTWLIRIDGHDPDSDEVYEEDQLWISF